MAPSPPGTAANQAETAWLPGGQPAPRTMGLDSHGGLHLSTTAGAPPLVIADLPGRRHSATGPAECRRISMSPPRFRLARLPTSQAGPAPRLGMPWPGGARGYPRSLRHARPAAAGHVTIVTVGQARGVRPEASFAVASGEASPARLIETAAGRRPGVQKGW
jgi:hypothetical protein